MLCTGLSKETPVFLGLIYDDERRTLNSTVDTMF